MILRPVQPDDAQAIADIYRHHVLHGTGTFEEVPPGPEEMARRMAAVLTLGLPWRAAVDEDGRMLGYAYGAPFRTRSAYRYTVEDSVYVAPFAHRRGVGRALLAQVIEDCRAMGLRQMAAVIGDSGNVGSIGLHAALGFQPAGVLPALGYKFGRWLDVVNMTLALTDAPAAPPEGAGLTFG